MKLFNKKKYSYPEVYVLDVEKKDLLSISDAYDDDMFEPTSWGKPSV